MFSLSFVLFISTLLHAYDSSVDRQLTGTVICSGSASDAALAFDDNSSTYYRTTQSDLQWVGLDFGEPCVITRVGYTSAPGSQGADRMLLSLFEGANSPDFMDAMPLYLISDMPSAGQATTADVNVSRGFRYVRYVGGAGSYCNVAELKFYGHAGEGDDSQFYQITNLPTLSIHVQDNILPTNRGEDFESQSVLIYENGTMLQEYPVLFRVRGNFSASHENKAFRIKYNDGKSHHVMRGGKNESPVKAKKWVLINSYRDKTLMRNPVAWAMSKRAEMKWTPWSQVVDLVVNGDYRGTYTIADHVDVHSGRIDITEMTESDIDEETITGGYYVEVDNNYSRETYHFLSSHGNTMSVHDPDEDVMQPEQFQYIQDTWNKMEDIVFGSKYTDKETGQRTVLDMETFLHHFLTSEFNGNTDMLCQVFLYKERGDDHFYTGPVWDADLALENDITTYPANQRMDWTYKVRDTGNWTQFVGRVLSDPSVFSNLQELWAKLRKKGAFEPDDVAADVDSLREEIRASARLNFFRWPYLNQQLSLNPLVPGSWEEEVDRVRDYVYERVDWMDAMLSYGRLRQQDGVYQIASGLDLCTFSQMVNEGGETTAEAVLTADIDMKDYNGEFQPIGNASNIFMGQLDGKGHVISNLNISGTEAVGLFGHVSDCTLLNIVFDESCSAVGQTKVGMLVGYAHNGDLTISGIENHAAVTASENMVGALLGYADSAAKVQVSDCCNTGNVTAQYNAAALVAPFGGSMTVDNCYNIGTVTGGSEGKDFAYATKSLTVNNCWDYASAQTNHMSSDQVESGYLCHHLNKKTASGAWRQNIDNGRARDLYPVLRKNGGRVFDVEGRYTNYNPNAEKFRYYNLVITQICSGSCIQFSEFDILDESLQEVEDLSVYDATESSIARENWPNVADNSVNTKYCNAAFNGYAYFLFDAMSEVVPSAYRIYTANDTGSHPERNPCSWKLYGSNTQLSDPDDSDWVLLDERDNDYSLPADNYVPTDFYITEPAKSITLNKQRVTLMPGDKVQLQVSYTPNTMQAQTLQWSTTNQAVATVDDQGLVEATGYGKADIIVSSLQDSTLRDTCSVVVVTERPRYRYFQFAIHDTQGASSIQLSEINLLDAAGNDITPLELYSYTGSYYSNEMQSNLFDGNLRTKFCGPFQYGTPIYLFVDAGSEVALSGYRLITANDTQRNPGRNPATWSLWGSNTLSEEPDEDVWKLLDSHEGDFTLGATNYQPYEFAISYPDPVFVFANNYTREYGEANPTFEYTSDISLKGKPQIVCQATPASPVGEYPIVISKGSVTSEVDAYVNGTLTITQAPLTVRADDAAMEEGAALPQLTLSYEGWKNGEDERVLTEVPEVATTATSQSLLGEYPIIVSGGQAQNYYFIYEDGTLTVTMSDGMDAVQPAEGREDIYNLQGVRVNRNYKGLVIVRGRKISVK